MDSSGSSEGGPGAENLETPASVGWGAQPDDAPPSGDVAELTAQLAQARADAEERLNAWKRARADYDNLKRRSVTEVEDRAAHARSALLLEFLPIVDNFERAFRADRHEDPEAWAEGISLIDQEIVQFLERLGVQPISAEGHVFDPNVHEAVAQTPGPDNEVVAEVRKGYLLGLRVLRPAMVVVGQGGAPSHASGDGSEPEQGGTASGDPTNE
jgi:molecular chaperone GrpE